MTSQSIPLSSHTATTVFGSTFAKLCPVKTRLIEIKHTNTITNLVVFISFSFSIIKTHARFWIRHALVMQDRVPQIPQKIPIHEQRAFYTPEILDQSVLLTKYHGL